MRTQSRLRGFTLTEILIVLAIIAVLASILFTVFGRVRENGRATTCRGNLKQLALAFQLYTQDNDGFFPVCTTSYYLKGYIPENSKANLRRCPTYPKIPESSEDDQDDYDFNNALFDKNITFFTGKRESAISTTSTTWIDTDAVLHFDNDYEHVRIVAPATGMLCSFSNWHSGGANFSFLDGHVKWVSQESACSLYQSNPGITPERR